MTSVPVPDTSGPVGDEGRPRAVYEKIRDAILDGRLNSGSQLVEVALAKWCGVSRTPIREALTRLEQDGLVERADRGLVVRQRSPEEILDIYESRVVLETAVARMATERHTAMDLIRIEQFRRVCENADPHEPGLLAQYNRDFHRGIWTASHNQSMIDLLDRLNLHLSRYPATTLSYPGRWDEALAEHRGIASAIVAGDAEQAAVLAREHFANARDIRLKLWAESTI